MKNQLTDLNNHLFAQLERLNDEELTAEAIDVEVRRASAMAGVADRIIGNATLVLKAQKAVAEGLVQERHPLLQDQGGSK